MVDREKELILSRLRARQDCFQSVLVGLASRSLCYRGRRLLNRSSVLLESRIPFDRSWPRVRRRLLPAVIEEREDNDDGCKHGCVSPSEKVWIFLHRTRIGRLLWSMRSRETDKVSGSCETAELDGSILKQDVPWKKSCEYVTGRAKNQFSCKVIAFFCGLREVFRRAGVVKCEVQCNRFSFQMWDAWVDSI